MKRLILSILLLLPTALSAQFYHPGEVLEYRVSYSAKYFPNTEIGSVDVTTTAVQEQGKSYYRVEGVARTLPTYRWFFNMEDRYIIDIDPETMRTEKFRSDLMEGSYTFESNYDYDWEQMQVHTRWSSRKRPFKEKTIALTPESMDAISLFFNMRSAKAENFSQGEIGTLDMLLEDTVRRIHYRFLGHETKKIRNLGKFRSLKFECQLGSSEGYSFTDGSIFTIWISDDENKIPLAIESPVRIGSINGYIYRYKGLKYPVKSRLR
ncbi:MAG: DUF3108 domain-containing protein [Alistipes sp.]|nr:DUF3108 domain-containing protein [Alistipes sp.]